jgi:hypothetical protein
MGEKEALIFFLTSGFCLLLQQGDLSLVFRISVPL